MAEFLRVVRQARWFRLDWLPSDELQADAFSDLQTRDNKLSVYRLDSDADVQLVIVALAATREQLDNLDYVVFNDSGLGSLSIDLFQETGETPSDRANNLHWELRHLTNTRLLGLAQLLSESHHDRISKKQVQLWLKDALRAGVLDESKMKNTLLAKLKDS